MDQFANACAMTHPYLPFDKLKHQWRLRTGDLFDGVYFDEFKEKSFKPWLETYAPNTGVQLIMSPNRNKLAVNVTLVPPPPKMNPPER